MLISHGPHFTEVIASKAKLGNQRDVDAFCPVAVLSKNSMMNVGNEEGGRGVKTMFSWNDAIKIDLDILY